MRRNIIIFLAGLIFLISGIFTSASTLSATTYTWNPDGRLARIDRPNNTRREIQYDGAGRPQIITESTTAGKLIHLQKLTYYPSDEVKTRYVIPSFAGGNPTPAPPLSGLTFGASNQLTAFPGKVISYDLDGNMTQGPLPNGAQGSFAFDARNRLTSAGGTAITYDAEGQHKTVTEAGVTSIYVMDASGPGKVLQRTKGTNTTRYVWGIGLCYEVNVSGNTTTYHYDATGSAIALTDDNSKIIERVEYSPYGLITRRWNESGTYQDTPFLYTGMFGNETDANGLIHMRARYYHPLLGRFLTSDPARDGWNWHAYAGGNPIGNVDPSGMGADSALDTFQTALSFVGLVPGLGIAADILNAGISIGRGNYGSAALYGAAALTGGAIGLAVGMEARVGARLETEITAKTAARVETTALSTYRSTTAGETFIRYESANPAFSKFTTNGGLPSGSYAAPMSDGFIPVADRIGVYNLPSANIPRTSATIFSPPTGTPIIGPRPVIGGSGNEVLFPFGFKP